MGLSVGKNRHVPHYSRNVVILSGDAVKLNGGFAEHAYR